MPTPINVTGKSEGVSPRFHDFAGPIEDSTLIDTLTQKTPLDTLLATTKSYDNLQRLTGTSSDPLAGTPVSSTYTYNTANQRTQHTLENGEYWDYSYDDLGQVTGGAKKLSGGTTIPGLDYSYAFDEIGNRETASSNLSPANDGTYTADALNQYSQRSVPRFVDILGTADPSATVTVNSESTTRTGEYFLKTFDYSGDPDPDDARLDFYSIVATIPGGSSGGADAVAEEEEEGEVFLPANPEAFTYDDDGNLLSDGQWDYTWNGDGARERVDGARTARPKGWFPRVPSGRGKQQNRLISMETAAVAYNAGVERLKLEFVYDSQGRRIQKQVYSWDSGTSSWDLQSESLFLYDGWNLIWEQTTEGSEDTEKAFVWGLDLSGSLQGAGGVGGLLQMTVSVDGATPNAFLPAYDGNGNVVALFDENGSLAASYEYGPFGEPVGFVDEAVNNPFRFSTKYWDGETSLNYYGFRYYDPETGRWPNRDPIEEEGGLNLYGFVGNDGVNFIDFLGLEVIIDEFKVVAKSWIGRIDMDNLGDLDSVTGRSLNRQLRSFARFLNSPVSGGISPTPTSDEMDGEYRLFSERTFVVKCNTETGELEVDPGELISHTGSELFIFNTTSRTGNESATLSRDGTEFNFSWTMAGRPHGLADSTISGPAQLGGVVTPSFSGVRYRNPQRRWIHHSISGVIRYNSGSGEIEIEVDLSGSAFPSHRSFINGDIDETIEQGQLSELWNLAPINQTIPRN